MLDYVILQNFKAFEKVQVPLSPFTLLIGPNGSGKTSILQALEYAHATRSMKVSELFESPYSPSVIRRKNTERCQATVLYFSEGGEEKQYAQYYFRPPQGNDQKWSLSHKCQVGSGNYGAAFDLAENSAGKVPYWNSPFLGTVAPSVLLLNLDIDELAGPSFSEGFDSKMQSNGGRLAAVLADWKLTRPREFEKYEEQIKSVIPSLRGIGFAKKEIKGKRYDLASDTGAMYRLVETSHSGYQVVLDIASVGELTGPQISEGTLLTLGLFAATLGQPPRSLVLVDGLDRGLHPRALGECVRQFRKIREQQPEVQIIATTHSPYLVDHFKANEVVLTMADENGVASAARLDEHPDFDRWKDEMSPGEFWSSVGEEWVIEAAKKKNDKPLPEPDAA